MKHFLILAIALFSSPLSAQEFTVPKDLQLETAADYLAQNDNIVAAVIWLRDTHLNKEQQKRKRVNTYLLQWLTGTPTMTITLGPGLADYGDCSDCLMLYMGGYAKAIIESGDDEPLATNLAAVRTVMDFYQNNKGRIGKNKVLQKFLKMEGKGKLEAEVTKRM
ncbi:MAG: phosphoketolase [Neolewinella sp.]|jgi:phosphoketolase